MSIVCVAAATAWLQGLVPWSTFLADRNLGEHLYDRQLAAWMGGRWDLPSDGGERWLVDGRFYIYFGPVPVLLRAPFSGWVLAHVRKSASISILAAALLAFVTALALARDRLGHDPPPWACMALAAPVILIASRTAVYNEAIAWAAALALLAALAYLRYLRRPSLSLLAALFASALFAVHARALWWPAMTLLLLIATFPSLLALVRSPWSAATRAALGLPFVPRPARQALFGASAVLALALSVPGINYLKCGRWVIELPLDGQAQFRAEPARLAHVRGRQFHLVNLPTNAWAYLSPTTVGYEPGFPWIRPVATVRQFPGARIDDQESMLSLWHVMALPLLLTAWALVAAARDPRARGAALGIGALALGPCALLFFIAVCGRYLFDFLPPLALGTALALPTLGQATGARRATVVLALLLAGYNLIAATSAALVDQRWRGRYGHAAQVEAWARAIDARLGAN